MLTRAQLYGDLRARAFGLQQRRPAHPTIGAELEFLPLRADDHSVMPLFGRRSIVSFVREVARQFAWREHVNSADIPWFSTPSGGMITFEPGGQIEYSSTPFRSADALLDDLGTFATGLLDAAHSASIELVSAGIDPYNDISAAPLQLRSPRYSNMARYFERIGPAGARMMRQTTAVQINLGLGPNPLARWHVLNALAPALSALFANSRMYAGSDTGYASYRAQVWRETDPLRTGVFAESADPVEAYLDFALAAPVIVSPFGDRDFHPFQYWQERAVSLADWRSHLTTLFPEIRPKGYFELRSIDAQPIERLPLVIGFVCGLAFDEAAAQAAAVLLSPPSLEQLERAGRFGLQDPEFHEACTQLGDLAWAGCKRLGASFIDPGLVAKLQEEWAATLGSGACAQ
jgi:glutamate--cysteine ligase